MSLFSETSEGRVMLWPIDWGGGTSSRGMTGESSMPCPIAWSCFPREQNRFSRASVEVLPSCPQVLMPRSDNERSKWGPIPQSLFTGRCSMTDETSSWLIATRPSGFLSPLASFARSLLGAIPMEQVRPRVALISFLIEVAICSAV